MLGGHPLASRGEGGVTFPRASGSLFVVVGITVAVLLAALPAVAHTPTQTFGPSPTPTRTGTLPPPRAVITAVPNPARSGQRVVLDGSGSLRAGGLYQWSQVGGELAVQIEDADQAVASFIVPPLSAPTAITVALSLGFVPAQQEIALLPPETVRLEVDRVAGAPGVPVDLAVRMRPLGYAVTELHHELAFDRFAAVAGIGTAPDCSAGQTLFVESARFAFLPEGCTPDVDCTAVRADLVTREPIPDGAVAYRCNVVSHDEATPDDCFHALVCGAGQAGRVGGQPLAVDCVDGGVMVNELVTEVAIALGVDDLAACPAADGTGDGQVTIDDLIRAITAALDGCPIG